MTVRYPDGFPTSVRPRSVSPGDRMVTYTCGGSAACQPVPDGCDTIVDMAVAAMDGTPDIRWWVVTVDGTVVAV